jgi:hypothetical protein
MQIQKVMNKMHQKIEIKDENIKKKPQIFWAMWFDPFDSIEKFNLPEDEDEDLENLYNGKYEEEAFKEENNIVDTSLITKKPFRIAITQAGAIPFYENTLPSKIFKFWEGHTNFNISQKVAKVVENTEGVETLDIFTRYRMRVGVGKAFDSREVRQKVQKNIEKLFEKREINE